MHPVMYFGSHNLLVWHLVNRPAHVVVITSVKRGPSVTGTTASSGQTKGCEGTRVSVGISRLFLDTICNVMPHVIRCNHTA